MNKVLTEESLENALARCRQKLIDLEDEVTDFDRLERLQREHPNHVALVTWRSMRSLSTVLALAALAVLIAPLLSADLARGLLQLEAVTQASPPGVLAMLALLSILIGQGGRALAIHAGSRSTLLPREYRKRIRLKNESMRLKTVLELRKRTATPVERIARRM